MKVLFDLGHPAHVHYFKNLIELLQKHGHKVLVIARKKDVTQKLLKNYKIPYISMGEGSNTLIGKFFYLLICNLLQ